MIITVRVAADSQSSGERKHSAFIDNGKSLTLCFITRMPCEPNEYQGLGPITTTSLPSGHGGTHRHQGSFNSQELIDDITNLYSAKLITIADIIYYYV